MQNLTLAGSPATQTLAGVSCGTTASPVACTDQFNTNGATPISGLDTPSLMAGRSFNVSVTFGIAPRR